MTNHNGHRTQTQPAISTTLQTDVLGLNWLHHRHIAFKLADSKLTVPQFFTLYWLYKRGGSSKMGDMARDTYQVSATMTGIVDRLSRAGLVERSRGEEDRRMVTVMLTPAGRDMIEQASEARMAELEDVLQGFKQAEQETILRFVKAMLNMIRDQQPLA